MGHRLDSPIRCNFQPTLHRPYLWHLRLQSSVSLHNHKFSIRFGSACRTKDGLDLLLICARPPVEWKLTWRRIRWTNCPNGGFKVLFRKSHNVMGPLWMLIWLNLDIVWELRGLIWKPNIDIGWVDMRWQKFAWIVQSQPRTGEIPHWPVHLCVSSWL